MKEAEPSPRDRGLSLLYTAAAIKYRKYVALESDEISALLRVARSAAFWRIHTDRTDKAV
jgi:hypothetical protein